MKELFMKALKTSWVLAGSAILYVTLLAIQGGWLGAAIGLGIAAAMWIEYVAWFVLMGALVIFIIGRIGKIMEKIRERRGA